MKTQRFEVAIYNENVKAAVYQAERNRTGLSDDWADTRYIEVQADTADAARQKVSARHPAARGFVIVDIKPLDS